MKLTDVLAELKKVGTSAIRTGDVMAMFGINKSHASKTLSRLEMSGHIVRLKRGLWVLPDSVTSFDLPALLAAPFPCYISLQSALYHHGMISQIPTPIYAISPARTSVIKTRLGIVSFHHIASAFFFGYEAVGPHHTFIATPEKALVDYLYLSSTRSRLFAALPELELPPGFSKTAARTLVNRIPDTRRRSLVRKKLDTILKAG